MTGKSSTDLNSVLPPDARVARIAAGGGLVVSLRGRCPERTVMPDVCRTDGSGPDRLDFIMPHAADSRVEASLAVPRPSVPNSPYPNDTPT